jgi:hypothetical protein
MGFPSHNHVIIAGPTRNEVNEWSVSWKNNCGAAEAAVNIPIDQKNLQENQHGEAWFLFPQLAYSTSAQAHPSSAVALDVKDAIT